MLQVVIGTILVLYILPGVLLALFYKEYSIEDIIEQQEEDPHPLSLTPETIFLIGTVFPIFNLVALVCYALADLIMFWQRISVRFRWWCRKFRRALGQAGKGT